MTYWIQQVIILPLLRLFVELFDLLASGHLLRLFNDGAGIYTFQIW